ncbi:hypothetical protein [uncultured Corynebacterium sp.]|uniref:hypothetical protein n=1 Tax=uncultured Corynebacterium sp. TaxID=159447 RepID=UPI0028D425BF|nr:hypothetical protein [uncultured Corynebacterium sp.]
MTNRSDGHDDELVRALDELFADDVFLTELSRGVDVSDGEDPLADLFLALRDEVESDMPPTPALADLGIDDSDEYFDDDYDDQLTATDVFVAIDEDDFDDDDLDDSEFNDDKSDDDLVDSEEDADDDQPEDDDDADNVIDLNSRRRWGLGRIASGLIGAAAATLVLAGAGGAVMSAKEGSPFYGLHQKLFGERADKAAVIELASKLEEVTNRTNKGDVKGAQQSLQEAQKIVDKLHNGQDKVEAQQKVDNTKTTVTTVTVTPPAPSPAPAQTTTVTVTVEAVPPAVAPVQTQQQQPQNAGTPTQVAPVRPSDGAQAPGAEPSQGQAPADPPLQLPDEYRR